MKDYPSPIAHCINWDILFDTYLASFQSKNGLRYSQVNPSTIVRDKY